MKLSAPVFKLKHQAKQLSKRNGIRLHQALDAVAAQEGFSSWSMLAAKFPKHRPGQKILNELSPGEMILLGARPGHGKTILGLEVVALSSMHKNHGCFFTLEYNRDEVIDRIGQLGFEFDELRHTVFVDTSEQISADYIIRALTVLPANPIVVIDYLQLLDQKRTSPDLSQQLQELKHFAAKQGICMIFISQVHRSFDLSRRRFPGLDDIRLPNPVDLGVFNKACFVHNREFVCNPLQ